MIKFITENSRVVALDNGMEIGEITWIKIIDVIDIEHTFVQSSYRGQKIAEKLVEHAINYVEDNNLKVIAACWYANKIISENDEYNQFLKH